MSKAIVVGRPSSRYSKSTSRLGLPLSVSMNHSMSCGGPPENVSLPAGADTETVTTAARAGPAIAAQGVRGDPAKTRNAQDAREVGWVRNGSMVLPQEERRETLFGALFYRYIKLSRGLPDNRRQTLKYGRPHRARVPPRILHAGAAEGLCHGHVGRVLHDPREAPAGGAREREQDPPGQVPVLCRPRAHDAAGAARLPEGRPRKRPGMVGPGHPEHVPCTGGRGG